MKTFLERFREYHPQDRLKRLLEHAEVETLRADKETKKGEAVCRFPQIVSKDDLYCINEEVRETYGLSYFKIFPKYDSSLFTEKYLPQVFAEAAHVGAITKGFFNDYKSEVKDGKITVEISFSNGGIELLYQSNTPQVVSDIIYSEFGLRYAVEIRRNPGYTFDFESYDKMREEEFRVLVKDQTDAYAAQAAQRAAQAAVEEAPKLPVVNTLSGGDAAETVNGTVFRIGNCTFDVSEPSVVFGKPFEINEVHPIRNITSEARNVTLLCKVVSLETKENRKGDKTIMNLALTDEDASIMAKKILPNEEIAPLLGALKKVKKSVKRGTIKVESFDTGLAVRGDVRLDSFDNELTFSPRDVMTVKLVPRMDNAPEKRVELHCHTNMSALDATIPPDVLVATAKAWGHPAVAVTDHGNVQAFPEMMLAAIPAGLKVIYGMEAYFVDDTARAVYGQKGPIGFDDEFVVFDIETTGLSNIRDRITEIGAVRVRGDEVIDRFESFVNPGMPIPANITELTGITDEMVSGADPIDEVLPRFLSFVGDSTLVAHNASFDVGFIRMAAERLGIETSIVYLDTVAMSKYCNPELKKHKLDTVAEYFGLGDFNHHRASDDAEMLSKIFFCMTDKLRREGINSIDQLNVAMSEHADPLKLRTYHMIILAKNLTGLKNLYQLISASYLNYFYKHPRIPKTLLQQHREGLIIGSACESGELFTALVDNKPADELREIAEFYDYLEIQPICNNRFMIEEGRVNDDEDLREYNRRIVALGEELGKPVVATCDAHFMEKHEEIIRKVLLKSMKFRDADRDTGIYFRTTEEMLEEFAYLGEEKAYEVVVKNTNLIADQVEQIRPIPEGQYTPHMDGAEEELQQLCWDRAKDWYEKDGVIPEVVRARLEKELDSIIKHGFAVLYMIAQRLVKKSVELGYMVGSRGSVGSSFVAIMSGISEVNPLPPHYRCPNCRYSNFDHLPKEVGSGYDLPDMDCPECGTRMIADGHDIPFETFLGFYGDKSPDIDLNFSGDVQGKIHKYTEELFGEENVFRAGTIGTLAEKTAFGFAMRYGEDHGVTLNKAEVARIVKGLVGIKRTTGQHPGGIIVVPKEFSVYDFTPVQHPADAADSDIVTTHFQFSYLHDTILKLDELGHDMPTKLKILERYTGIKPTEIPMNDPMVYDLFSSTKSLGIKPEDILGCQIGTYGLPELGTRFAQQMIMDAQPKNFADMLQISGLSHGTDVWLGNAQDLIKEGVCTISEVIGTRDSIMLRLIAWGVEKSLSFKIMESVRKGKGLTPEMESAMREKNVPDWYIASCKKIKYMFPKAHAAAYVMQAIQFAWYKVHRPLEFYAAYFTAAPGAFDSQIVLRGKAGVERVIGEIEKKGNEASAKEKELHDDLLLVNESLARGVRYLPVDLNHSDAYAYLCEDGAIRVPFTSLPGLGGAAAENIVKARKDGEFFSKLELQDRAHLTKAVMELLDANGVLKGMPETNQLTLF